MSTKRLAARLAELGPKQLVRLRTRFEDAECRGYIAAQSATHVVIALVNDQVRFDGFDCFRLGDLRTVSADPHATFIESALKKRGLRRPARPKLKLDSTGELLVSAGKAFPLVTIHQEAKSPGVCHIGSVRAVNASQLALLEIGPDAVWDAEPTVYALRAITRVSVGGDYEDALALVGGKAPVVQ